MLSPDFKQAFGLIAFTFQNKKIHRRTFFSNSIGYPFICCGHKGCPEAAYTTMQNDGKSLKIFAIAFLKTHWEQNPHHFGEFSWGKSHPDEWMKTRFNVHSLSGPVSLPIVKVLQWGPHIGFPLGCGWSIERLCYGTVSEDLNCLSMTSGPSLRCSNCDFSSPSYITYEFSELEKRYTSTNFNRGIYELVSHWERNQSHFLSNGTARWKLSPFDHFHCSSFDFSYLSPWVFDIKSPEHSQPIQTTAMGSNTLSFEEELERDTRPWLYTYLTNVLNRRWQGRVDISIQTLDGIRSVYLVANEWGLIQCQYGTCAAKFPICFQYEWNTENNRYIIRLSNWIYSSKTLKIAVYPRGLLGIDPLVNHWLQNPEHVPYPPTTSQVTNSIGSYIPASRSKTRQ